MNRFLSSVATGVLIIVVVIWGADRYTDNNTSQLAAIIDWLNPFISVEEVYVQVPTPCKYETKFLEAGSRIESFAYVEDSYNQKGRLRKLKFVSFGKQLSAGKWLKITTKGQNVQYWQEVLENEVPEEIIAKLALTVKG